MFSGGPRIAYRGGRVDATGPNAPGVPEPHQPLEVHVDKFARQGFTSEEMIGLVACELHNVINPMRSLFLTTTRWTCLRWCGKAVLPRNRGLAK
jgi:hypothetical protein